MPSAMGAVVATDTTFPAPKVELDVECCWLRRRPRYEWLDRKATICNGLRDPLRERLTLAAVAMVRRGDEGGKALCRGEGNRDLRCPRGDICGGGGGGDICGGGGGGDICGGGGGGGGGDICDGGRDTGSLRSGENLNADSGWDPLRASTNLLCNCLADNKGFDRGDEFESLNNIVCKSSKGFRMRCTELNGSSALLT